MNSLLLFLGLIAVIILVDQQILLVSAFSRDLRSFYYSIEKSCLGHELLIKFDPFLENFDEAVKEICRTQLSCQLDNVKDFDNFVDVLNTEYTTQVNENILEIYQLSIFSTSREGQLNTRSTYAWLEQADASTYEEALIVQQSTARLWEILQHLPTASATASASALDLDMHQDLNHLAAKWSISTHLHIHSTLADLLDVAIQLFNNNYYEQSFAVATHILFQQPEFHGRKEQYLKSFRNSQTVYQLDVGAQVSLFSLLSELFQLSNNALGSVAFHAKTLLLLSKQMIYSSDTNGNAIGPPKRGIDSLNAYLAKMRVLIFLPIVPSSFAIAIKHRVQMIADIDALTASIVANKAVRVPIQDVVDKLSATFFRLPHQGLNDKAINVAITHLYEALCPDFSYLAPRLRMSEPPLPPPSQLLSRLEPLQNGALDFTGGKRKKIEQGRREQEGQQGSEQREKQNLVIPDVLQNKSNHYRVAFVSSHFFRHSIGNMLIEIMYRMKTDAKSAGFGHLELFAFFMTDPSRPQEDELTAAFAELLQDNFVRISLSNIQQMRRALGSEEYNLDVIIFADVGMEMHSVILANSRLAPLQIAWWGHPVTTASPAVDYFFGLDVEAPHAGAGAGETDGSPSAGHYSEQLVRHHWMNTAPITPISIQDRSEQSQFSSHLFGIPENSKHFMILGRLFKIHPFFDESLFNILRKTPTNVYILVIRESNNMALNSELYRRWKDYQDKLCCETAQALDGVETSCCGRIHSFHDFFQQQHQRMLNGSVNNVDTSKTDHYFSDPSYVLHRLRFVHYKHYVKALLSATAVLDTFPYGGCLTTHDALSNAIPMITLPLEHVRGRYSIGMYLQMNHPDLVARNPSVFVELAVRMAADDVFRHQQSQLLAEKYSNMHRNDAAAFEWMQFLDRAIKQQL